MNKHLISRKTVLSTGYFLLFFGALLIGEEPILKSGIINGILAAKGNAWVEVKNDQGYSHRYLAKWIGGGPSSGGGFDSKDLKMITNLVVGNRVRLHWFWENHLRIDRLRVISPPQSGGIFKGYVLETSDRWIDVQSSRESVPWRFYLPWSGGYPRNGGGYDKKLLDELNQRIATDPVRFRWVYDQRSRIVELYERGEDQFVPFYVGKKDTYRRPRPAIDKKDEQATPDGTNPFEQATPAGNPFEQATPAGNPFEQATPAGNPFEKATPAGNPFEQATPAGNPFEGMPLP